MKKKFAIGVTLFGLYFIADSFFQLYMKFFSPNYYLWYSSIFQPLPEKIIFLRYVFSIIFRVIELAFGLGILCRKDLFRKLAIFMSWFAIAVIYWKHPVGAFTKHANAVINHIYPATNCQLSSPVNKEFVYWVSLGVVYAIDIGIAALAIYYFTRPRIKEEFKK
jgi:small-conductance mechanosensitive channel